MSFIFLILGFALLVKGADLLVDSSSKLARMYGISSFIIGLSVVAFGTSAPEAAIGVISGIRQNNQIIFGTVIGSSIANIALIVGLTAAVMPINVKESIIKKEIPISLVSQILLFILIVTGSIISRIEAVLLIALFVVFLYYIAVRSNRIKDTAEIVQNPGLNADSPAVLEEKNVFDLEAAIENSPEVTLDGELQNETSRKFNKSLYQKLKLIVLIIVGLTGLVFGGNLVIENGTKIALMFGLSETFIGLTVVAIGTSLPELVTSIVAAIKKESDIAIGNVIGSNIFNVLFVLGISSLIYPINIAANILVDMGAMILLSVLLLLFSATQRKVTRSEGVLFFVLYLVYIVFAYTTGSSI